MSAFRKLDVRTIGTHVFVGMGAASFWVSCSCSCVVFTTIDGLLVAWFLLCSHFLARYHTTIFTERSLVHLGWSFVSWRCFQKQCGIAEWRGRRHDSFTRTRRKMWDHQESSHVEGRSVWSFVLYCHVGGSRMERNLGRLGCLLWLVVLRCRMHHLYIFSCDLSNPSNFV